jgi:hypothetical protein
MRTRAGASRDDALLQTLANLPVIAREGDAAALDGLLAGHPAVIVGAGPSLDDQLPALAALQDRAVVVAPHDAAALLAGGVRPRRRCRSASWNAPSRRPRRSGRYLPHGRRRQPAPSAFTGFAGRTFVFKVSDHEPWPWLRAAGLDRGTLRAWGSVVTTAFDLAVRLGCAPIVFAGLDLSYPVRRPYCANTIYDATWREAMATYGCTWEQLVDDYFGRLADLRVPDLHGRPVLTSPHLISFRDWLCQQVSADSSRRYVNTTGAGILHGANLEHATLHDVLGPHAPLGGHVRDILRSARAQARPHDGLTSRRRELLAQPTSPGARETLAHWMDFSAGAVTADEIRRVLSSGQPA